MYIYIYIYTYIWADREDAFSRRFEWLLPSFFKSNLATNPCFLKYKHIQLSNAYFRLTTNIKVKLKGQ